MKKDTHKTDITFRVDSDNIVFALFPHEVSTLEGHVTTYEHIGQHSAAEYKHCIAVSRMATKDEYHVLKLELESIGYNVNVVKRRNYDKYLKSFKNV